MLFNYVLRTHINECFFILFHFFFLWRRNSIPINSVSNLLKRCFLRISFLVFISGMTGFILSIWLNVFVFVFDFLIFASFYLLLIDLTFLSTSVCFFALKFTFSCFFFLFPIFFLGLTLFRFFFLRSFSLFFFDLFFCFLLRVFGQGSLADRVNLFFTVSLFIIRWMFTYIVNIVIIFSYFASFSNSRASKTTSSVRKVFISFTIRLQNIDTILLVNKKR